MKNYLDNDCLEILLDVTAGLSLNKISKKYNISKGKILTILKNLERLLVHPSRCDDEMRKYYKIKKKV